MLIVDNDALVKLASWDLLNELGAFAGGWPNIAVISSVPVRIAKSVEKPGTGVARDNAAAVRLNNVLSGCAALPAPSPAVLSALQGVPGADAGEILLLGALHAMPDAVLVTGDKRALKAFGGALPVSIVKAVAGRVLCLEQFLHLLCERHGFSAVTMKAAAQASTDMTAMIIFGKDGKRSEEEVRAGLGSYIGDVGRESGGLIELDHVERYRDGLDSS